MAYDEKLFKTSSLFALGCNMKEKRNIDKLFRQGFTLFELSLQALPAAIKNGM